MFLLPQLNYKRLSLIGGFIIICLVLIYLVIRVFFIGPTRQEPDKGVIPSAIPLGQLPTTGQAPDAALPMDTRTMLEKARDEQVDDVARGGQTLTLPLNENRALDPTPARGGNDVAFYDQTSGKFYRVSADGASTSLLTDERFFYIEAVSWTKNSDKAVLEYPDGSNILYDFTTRQSVTLPKELEDPVFSPRSNTLAFKIKTDNFDDNWLVVTDSDGNNPRFIEPLGDNSDQVQVAFSPDEQVVALFHQPVGVNQEEILFIGQSGENFKSIIVDGLNFHGIYSPDGKRLLYHVISSTADYQPELWVIDAKGSSAGGNRFNLGLHTWIEKCVFAQNSRTVYCAVPENLDEGAGLLKIGIIKTKDVFYRIDLDTGLKNLLAQPFTDKGALSVSVMKIWLDSQEYNLFFWDSNEGKVYKIRLR